ncbi:MAG: hypothetical protein D6729_19875 [Deltaproteobacteria bacterium]|nr:MAG: hypothetical protein D6729_19875 [Deltaproteobacteria bacterium]
MNLKERRWRVEIEATVKALERAIAEEADLERQARLIELRERLAGALGAEEGWHSTRELRRRAAADHARAWETLGQDRPPLPVPRGDPPARLVARDFARYRPVLPRHGDRS